MTYAKRVRELRRAAREAERKGNDAEARAKRAQIADLRRAHGMKARPRK